MNFFAFHFSSLIHSPLQFFSYFLLICWDCLKNKKREKKSTNRVFANGVWWEKRRVQYSRIVKMLSLVSTKRMFILNLKVIFSNWCSSLPIIDVSVALFAEIVILRAYKSHFSIIWIGISMTKNGQNKTQYSFDKLRFRGFFLKREGRKR